LAPRGPSRFQAEAAALMQRVFVYEYLCATGMGAGSSLQVEGRAMLAAVLADLGKIAGVEPVTLLAGGEAPHTAGTTVRRTGAEEEPARFRELSRACDSTVIIAPECGGILGQRCRWAEDAGGRLLGPGSAAVALAADKEELARRWQAAGVRTPPCTPLSGPVVFPAVCKPRHGAGSQTTFLVRGPDELPGCLAGARAEGWEGELLLQPFVPGRPASVALLLGPGQEIALPPAWQRLSPDGRFRYLGGALPLPPGPAARAAALARQAVRAVPGLRGYVGVDLVLGEAPDGSGDQAIEINPRLTTSYVGLRALAAGNLAEALLRVVSGERIAELEWRPGVVEFGADGQVTKGEGVLTFPET
jgi:predicted ATP-grasp superfamily ATP-dependent carboligase